MADLDTTWPIPTVRVSESKDSWKSGVNGSPTWELVGVDGTNKGGLALHKGFREAWVFGPENLAGTQFPGNSNVNPYATNTNLFDVVDFWPASMRIGASYWAYGVIYIASRPSSSTRDLIFEGYRTDTSTKFYKVILEGSTLLNTGYAVSVTCTPRVVYVGIAGRAPKAICFSGTSTFTLNVVDAGPGQKPTGTWVSADTTAFTPTTTQLPDPASGPPGSFVVYGTSGTSAPTNWAAGSTAWTDTGVQFTAGNYSYAVQFEDSTTGRRSQLSDLVPVTWTGVKRRITITGIVDTAKYDTVKIYRSTRSYNTANIFSAGIVQLESTFKASDKSITPATSPSWSPALAGTVVKWATVSVLDDRQLVMQDVFLDNPSFLNDVPWGGAVGTMDNQLIVSNIVSQSADTKDQMKSVGEIRWSSATDGSYELFSPRGRWTPESFGDSPIVFKRAGQVLVGLSQNRVYFIARNGAYTNVTPAHTGFGVVNPNACSVMGPMLYYVTRQGMKSVYADGRLDEVGAVDWLISVDWFDDLDYVSMANDPKFSCMYMLNPIKGKIAMMWFSTGMVSEVHDVGFKKCANGWWTSDADDYGAELTDRALFLFAPSGLVHTSKTTGYRPRLMVAANNSTDRKVPPADSTNDAYHYGTVDGPGERRTTCTATANSTYFDLAYTPPATPWTPTWRTLGMYARVLSSSVVATRLRVVGITSGDKPTVENVGGASLPTDGSSFRVILNSMVFRMESTCLPGGQEGQPGNQAGGGFTNIKQVSGLTCIFRNVSLSPGVVSDNDGKWKALVYRGDLYTPTAAGFSSKPDGTATTSIVEGATPIAAPFGTHGVMDPNPSIAVEICAVGMTFRVIAISVKGRILGTERTSRNYA